jgi:hypothetical protein
MRCCYLRLLLRGKGFEECHVDQKELAKTVITKTDQKPGRHHENRVWVEEMEDTDVPGL